MTVPESYLEEAICQAAITIQWQASDASENGGNSYPITSTDKDDYTDRVAEIITDDVTVFITDNYATLQRAGVTAGQAGHDLILTANGHGAGFWDRGLGEAGQQLSDACKPYSFDAEFRLWGENADDDEHCSDELAWFMVENEVLLDELGWSSA